MAGRVEITVQVNDLGNIVSKLQGTAGGSLFAEPLRRGLTASALLVEGEAKRLAPADTGNLRRSITHLVDSSAIPTFARVGTNAPYALAVHEGRKKGSMPPVSALLGWARRHGMNAFVVARAIGRRGIRARPFLLNAFTAMRGQIDSAISQAAREIESQWGRR